VHPNPAKAADGKQLHALAIDDTAAAVVQRRRLRSLVS
jgi:hypothetical protein